MGKFSDQNALGPVSVKYTDDINDNFLGLSEQGLETENLIDIESDYGLKNHDVSHRDENIQSSPTELTVFTSTRDNHREIIKILLFGFRLILAHSLNV